MKAMAEKKMELQRRINSKGIVKLNDCMQYYTHVTYGQTEIDVYLELFGWISIKDSETLERLLKVKEETRSRIAKLPKVFI